LKIATIKGISYEKNLDVDLIGVLLLGSAARSQAQTTGGTERAVVALEEQWLQETKDK